MFHESNWHFLSCNRILEAIGFIVGGILIGNISKPVVITRRTFAVSAQQVDLNQFMEIGQNFSANLGNFSNLNTDETIDSSDLSFEKRMTTQATASIRLPNNLFSAVPNVTNNTRITHAVFLSDSLFLRRDSNDLEVGGIIISASVVGYNSIEGLDPPVSISFLKNPVYITMIDLILVVNLIFSYRVSMVQVFSALIGTPF